MLQFVKKCQLQICFIVFIPLASPDDNIGVTLCLSRTLHWNIWLWFQWYKILLYMLLNVFMSSKCTMVETRWCLIYNKTKLPPKTIDDSDVIIPSISFSLISLLISKRALLSFHPGLINCIVSAYQLKFSLLRFAHSACAEEREPQQTTQLFHYSFNLCSF